MNMTKNNMLIFIKESLQDHGAVIIYVHTYLT